MKINIKLFMTYLATYFLITTPFAKAQQPSPGCVSQCETFCAAVVANFANSGAGPLSQGTLFNLRASASSPLSDYAYAVAASIETMLMNMNRADPAFYSSLLGGCQSSSTYCSTSCTHSTSKSTAQKPTAAPQKAASAKKQVELIPKKK